MRSGGSNAGVLAAALVCMIACRSAAPPPDRTLQQQLEQIDARLRAKYTIAPEQTDVGLLDLERPRMAMIHPDHIEYAQSSKAPAAATFSSA